MAKSTTQHPTLAGAIKRFVDQFGVVDETATVVLKGHLLVEEALDGIISNFVFHSEHLSQARLSFAQKLNLARSMSDREDESSVWRIGTALNSLRNELAHSLESQKRAGKIQALLDAFQAETADSPQAKKYAAAPESDAVMMACALFVGFLASFRAEVDQFKEVVTTMRSIRKPAKKEAPNV